MPRAIFPGLFKHPLQRGAIIILHYWHGKRQRVDVTVTRKEMCLTYLDIQNVRVEKGGVQVGGLGLDCRWSTVNPAQIHNTMDVGHTFTCTHWNTLTVVHWSCCSLSHNSSHSSDAFSSHTACIVSVYCMSQPSGHCVFTDCTIENAFSNLSLYSVHKCHWCHNYSHTSACSCSDVPAC